MSDRRSTEQTAGDFELQFETLMGEMLTRFLNVEFAQIDRDIENSIRRVAEFMDLDEGLLIQWTGDPNQARPTHFWTIAGSLPNQNGSGPIAVPWVHSQLLLGRITAISRAADLPAEAAVDREFLQQSGRKSLIAVPIKIRGEVVGGLAFATLRTEVQWSAGVMQRLELVAEIFAGVLERKKRIFELDIQLQFESLLKEISSRFVNVRADQVQSTIEDAQRLICESLCLDRSSLFQCSAGDPGTMLLTHIYQRPDLPYPVLKRQDPVSKAESYWRLSDPEYSGEYTRIDGREMYPWFYEQLRCGKTVVVPDLQALGDEAAIDKKNLSSYGTKSTVVVPLFAGDEWIGILTFAAVSQRRDWTGSLVSRFQFLADLFTNALARKRAEQALRESEARYRGIFDAESDAVLVGDCETGTYLDANSAAAKMYGYSREEFLHLRNADLSAEPEQTKRSIAAGEKYVAVRWHRRKNGQVFPVELSADFMEFHGRKAYIAVVRDISERKKLEKELNDRLGELEAAREDLESSNDSLQIERTRYQELFESAPDAYFVTDLNGVVAEANRAAEELFNTSRAELRGNPLALFVSVPDHRSFLSQLNGLARRGLQSVARWEMNIQPVKAAPLPVSVTVVLARDAHNQTVGLRWLFRDITERKLAESRLLESEARFRVAADSAPVLLWLSGTDKLCTFFNQTWLNFTGRTVEQEMGNGWTEGVHPEDLSGCLKTYNESFDTRQPFTMHYRLRRHDGEYRWILDHGVPRYDADGKFAGFIGSCSDTTEVTLALKALERSEERFRQVAENVSDFIWEVDANGLYTYTSPSVERILGYTPEELVGKMHFYDLFAPETRVQMKTAALRMFADKLVIRDFSNLNVHKNGEKVYLETSGVPILDSSGNLVGYRGADRDVTERKRTEAALHHSWEEIHRLKDRLQAEAEYLRTEIKVTQSFGEIIGQSEVVKQVLHKIERVAPVESPVLITGETGTGKELIARAIHRLSRRHERAMIKLNCAALPSALVESELFGRERGAFTGAMTSQAGRFEVADGSTIFLDEVGELSPEIQAKLLRVLQEGEFERLGSPRVRKVNVRVIAATNRDLPEAVRKGTFRRDLYYRLSVFPIHIPPLRERTEDIPALISAFVTEFASRMSKKITKVPKRTMDAMLRYSWPGNIRELRNVLEHAVILSTDEVLRIPPLTDLQQSPAQPTTLVDLEREHILRVFERTGGRIKGPHGAAHLLGINPGTLYSRMRKLGIPNRRQQVDR